MALNLRVEMTVFSDRRFHRLLDESKHGYAVVALDRIGGGDESKPISEHSHHLSADHRTLVFEQA